MLYTDGLVETPGADLEIGIDRLLGVAERVVATGLGGAEAVLAGVGTGDDDDRALVLRPPRLTPDHARPEPDRPWTRSTSRPCSTSSRPSRRDGS